MRRIVLDTNCLLAILPQRSSYHTVWTAFLNDEIEFCVSTEILLEYEEIIASHASQILADAVLKTLVNKNNLVRIEPPWRFGLMENDPDDNKFVDCAICGNAEYIVTNDTHFNILMQIDFPIVEVIKIQDFVKQLN